MKRSKDDVACAIRETLSTPNESDRNLENANAVDGLYRIARALNDVASALREVGKQIAKAS